MAEKDKKMADVKEAVKPLETTELKPKQTWLNLDTGADEEVQLNYSTYKVNSKADEKAVLAELSKMISPDAEKVKALLSYANSRAYQAAKDAAMSRGNYLNAQLRSQLTGMMQNLQQFSELSAKECFERWLAGYKAKKTGAMTLLERAKAALAGTEFADL